MPKQGNQDGPMEVLLAPWWWSQGLLGHMLVSDISCARQPVLAWRCCAIMVLHGQAGILNAAGSPRYCSCRLQPAIAGDCNG